MVCPTIVGKIIDARDQVFTTFFSLREFSTKGPFLTDLDIYFDFLFFGGGVTKRSVRWFFRVFRPIAGLPHGVCAMPPTGDFASPPPCGWSRGDMTTPRTAGRQPIRRLCPAPPILRFSWSTLPI